MSEEEAGKKGRIPLSLIDIIIALALVASVFLAMFAYTGSWPPLVVVESRSMQHSETTSYIGIMDTGDLVMVKKVPSYSDITTYLSGKQHDYMTYGDYGDVLIYWREGNHLVTPIIHRAVLFLAADPNGSYSAPELSGLVRGIDYDMANDDNSWNNITDNFTIHNYGYADMEIEIPIKDMLSYMHNNGIGIHSGFITKGDFNPVVDQRLFATQSKEPIPFDWVVGRATGEIPWFGMMKLWFTGTLPDYTPANSFGALFVCLGVIIAVPVGSELFIWWRGRKGGEEESSPDVPPADSDKQAEPTEPGDKPSAEAPEEKL